ncbi:histidine kinase [Pseudoduganella dura]|nr:histidine kinase [Pseudoduganella dura]
MRWRWWILTVLLLPVVAAAAPADGISHHMQRWTQAQGAPLSSYDIAQTPDGLLWFGNIGGLFDFDGVRFRRRDAVYGHRLPANNINRVKALGNSLLLGYQTGGVTLLSPGRSRDWRPGEDGLPAGSVGGFAVDADGGILVGTTTGIARLSGGRWHRLRGNAGNTGTQYLAFDRDGTLWAKTNNVLHARVRGSDTFHGVAKMPDAGNPMLVDGRLTIAVRGRGFLELSGTGRHRPLAVETPGRYSDPLFSGPGGTLWTMRKDGVVRLEARHDGTLRAAELFDSGGDIARLVVASTIDREGNLWVSTLGGVERYRPHRIRRAALPDQMAQFLAQRGIGDEMWIGGSLGVVQRIGADGARGTLPLVGASAIHRTGADLVWAGNEQQLCAVRTAARRCWPLPPPLRGNDVQAITVDRAGRVWVSVVRFGLFRFDGARWVRDGGLAGMPAITPVTMLTGASGRTWIGYTEGRLGELTEAGIRMLPAAGRTIGNVLAMHEAGGRLLVGGDNGAGWLDGDTVRPLRPARTDALRGVAGIVQDRAGDLWLHGAEGLMHIAADELAAWFADPARQPEWEMFDFADGLLGQVAQLRPLPSLALGHDGRIWYATASAAGWIDPAAIHRNPLPPTVLIRSLRTPRGEHAAVDGAPLPERTTEIDIAFTATALSIPERVRLRYRLQGVDSGWREVEHERQAHYTNLAPGSYRFDVIAANEDGVWNRSGATLAFTIAPTVWQSTWFRAACAAALALAGWLAYRWRLAAATRLVAERAAARIDERERIARSLHDNLLQAVHALMLHCQVALLRLRNGTPAAGALEKALADADALVASTRDEVMALRGETTPDELLAGLRATVEALDPDAAGRLHVAFAGRAVALRGEAALEIGHVLREAALNSCRHAHASRIVVRLRLGPRALEGSVCDDGRGIDRTVARRGRVGHWGIVGMRERIGRLGGTLDIGAAPAGGTLVTFRIPAHAAYADIGRSTSGRLRAFVLRALALRIRGR